MTTRSWPMFALDFGGDGHGVRFRSIYGQERLTRMASGARPAVPATVTEDPDGDYYAWQPTGDDSICMIYSKPLFDIAFPAGADAEIARGHGQRISVRIDLANMGASKTS